MVRYFVEHPSVWIPLLFLMIRLGLWVLEKITIEDTSSRYIRQSRDAWHRLGLSLVMLSDHLLDPLTVCLVSYFLICIVSWLLFIVAVPGKLIFFHVLVFVSLGFHILQLSCFFL